MTDVPFCPGQGGLAQFFEKDYQSEEHILLLSQAANNALTHASCAFIITMQELYKTL